jgi:hypothetical protein
MRSRTTVLLISPPPRNTTAELINRDDETIEALSSDVEINDDTSSFDNLWGVKTTHPTLSHQIESATTMAPSSTTESTHEEWWPTTMNRSIAKEFPNLSYELLYTAEPEFNRS